MSNPTISSPTGDYNDKIATSTGGYSLGLKVLRRLCQEGNISAWQKAKLIADLFKVHELPMFDWVTDHVKTHQVLPNIATLEAHFPDTAGLETPEPSSYYVDLQKKQYLYSLINQANIDSQSLLKTDQNAYEKAAEVLRKALERIDANKHFAGFTNVEDIPNLLGLDIPEADWVVDQMICRNSITLWAGSDGTGKSYLATKLAVAIANGWEFLGRKCQQGDVLYLDYENPGHEIKARHLKMEGAGSPRLMTWGTWLDDPPPPIGDSRLLKIAQEKKPLMIFDPFRYAHSAEENDSTAMMHVMKHLRSYAAAGAPVIFMHHPAKAEGSTGRGSSVIKGAVDIAFLQEMAEDDLLTLKHTKNRFAQKTVITIQADFALGEFTMTTSKSADDHSKEIETLQQAIAQTPGIVQSALLQKVGIQKVRGRKLLKEQINKRWIRNKGLNNAWQYFPLELMKWGHTEKAIATGLQKLNSTGGDLTDEGLEEDTIQ